MQILQRFTLVIGFVVASSSAAFAGDEERAIIDKVVAAYGAEALTSMKSLVVQDRYKTIVKDGGVRPGLDAVSRLNSTLTIDFEQGKKSVKNWAVRSRGKRLGQIMFDGENGWSINFLRGSHVLRPDLNYNNVGAGMMRLLDTTLARSLWTARDTAEYDGQQSFLGRVHEKLTFKVSGQTEVTLFVDRQTGLISKMTRPNGASYVFSDHRKIDGVTFASDTNQFRNGQPVMMTLSRSIEVNPDVSGAFELPATTKALEGMQDTSKMVVKQLGEGVFIAGLGFRSSLFVDGGDHFVGIGGMPGFKKRLQAVQEMLGTDKPLKYLVVAEHQPGHLGDINAIEAMGASFVTAESHLPTLKKRFATPLADDRLITVEGSLQLADGKVVVHDISTITSDHFLLFYVPGAKLVFSMDEFGTNLLNSVPSADLRTLSFRKAIEKLGIDVQQFTHVHGTGVLTIEQLHQVTDSYQEGYCPEGHAICAD